MPISMRVRQDPFTPQGEVICSYKGQDYAADVTAKGKWRIYECDQEYTTTSGGHLLKGKVVRRYDPQAGVNEGKAAEFDSKQQAVEYAQRWLTK